MVARVSDILSQPGTWVGGAVAVAATLGTWLSGRRKSDIDESAMVLGAWKELVGNHQAQIKALVEEIGGLRLRLTSAEGRITVLEEENRTLRRENDGLTRQIAQKSQSEVAVLGGAIGGNAPTSKRRFADPDADLIAKLD